VPQGDEITADQGVLGTPGQCGRDAPPVVDGPEGGERLGGQALGGGGEVAGVEQAVRQQPSRAGPARGRADRVGDHVRVTASARSGRSGAEGGPALNAARAAGLTARPGRTGGRCEA
jgi:hypothetical protein